jgi:hypothetical protein
VEKRQERPLLRPPLVGKRNLQPLFGRAHLEASHWTGSYTKNHGP